MIIKVSTQQEDLTIVNTHAPNTGAANYISQFITKLKKHSNNNTTLVGDINTPITAMDKSPKQTNKEAKALNDTLEQMGFTDIFKIFYPKATEYTFFSSACGTFFRIDHILGHRSGLNRYQKLGLFPAYFQITVL